MADSLFDIFGDHLTRQTLKNVSRQPLSNIENMGKTVLSGPIKPNEPMKKGETKKSFLANAGKALQSTPMRKVFTSNSINVGSLIYNDEPENEVKDFDLEKIYFTRPTYKYGNNHKDLLDFLPLPNEPAIKELSPPKTPPPSIKEHSMEFDSSNEFDEFFTDDLSISNESIPVEDLGLPNIF